MAATLGGIIVNPDGVSTVVDITLAGTRPTAYTAAGGSETHSFPVTITTRTQFHVNVPGDYVVSAKRNGVEMAGEAGTKTVQVAPGQVTEITVGVNATAEAAAQEATWMHLAGSETVTGAKAFTARTTHTLFSLGAVDTPTIASGVLTVTSSHVNPLPESSTTDTVDSIVLSGQAAGDLLLIDIPATNTITFDNSATLLLGAGTREVAPGGSLLLIAQSATIWREINFLAAAS